MAEQDDMQLDVVQVLFRHGIRTFSKMEGQCLKDTDTSICDPYGFEQLTKEGKNLMYKFGCLLRNRYNDFLGDKLKLEELQAVTSDYDRTKMSLLLVLAGLYPPNEQECWNENLNWQPIPYNYVSRDKDILFKTQNTHKFVQYLRDVIKLEEVKKKTTEYLPVFELVKNHANNISSIIPPLFYSFAAFNTLNSQKYMSKPLPDWCSEKTYEDIKQMGNYTLSLLSYKPEMNKYNGGPLIKKFLDNILDDNHKKIYLYSGHDLNVSSFAYGLGLDNYGYPNFGSAIIIETFKNSNNQKFVRALRYTGVGEELSVMNLGNKEFCPLDEYKEIIKDVLPTDEELKFLMNNLIEIKDIFLESASM